MVLGFGLELFGAYKGVGFEGLLGVLAVLV